MLPVIHRAALASGVVAALLLLAAPGLARPATVLLLRHGHKPNLRSNDHTLNNNLSAQGWQQALHLARVVPACLGRGQRLRLASYRFDPLNGENARSYQTLVPLAVASGANITVYTDADSSSEADGRRVLVDPANAGALVVIAWEHRHLPALARGLGWASMAPIRDDDFDSLWQLRYPARDGAPRVTVLSQQALDPRRCSAHP
jgi:hypothetical protein